MEAHTIVMTVVGTILAVALFLPALLPFIGTFLIVRTIRSKGTLREHPLNADTIGLYTCGVFLWGFPALHYSIWWGCEWLVLLPLLFAIVQIGVATWLEKQKRGGLYSAGRIFGVAFSYLLFLAMNLGGKERESIARKLACGQNPESASCQEHSSPRGPREEDCAEDLRTFCGDITLSLAKAWYPAAEGCLKEHFLQLRPRCRRHVY